MAADEAPIPACNPFLIRGMAEWAPPGKRFYAVLDQAEPVGPGLITLIFSATDGDAFDARSTADIPAALALSNFAAIFDPMPIYLIEVDLSTSKVSELSSAAATLSASDQSPSADGPSFEEVLGTLEDLERRWLVIEIAEGDGGAAAKLYGNLFGAARPIRLASFSPPPPDANSALNSIDPLASEPDASQSGIRSALGGLSGSSAVAAIAFYDVGQGSAQGLLAGGRVAAYYDFGGGCAGHTGTFPSPSLTRFCFCRSHSPAIILSHWDHDHWSSEGRDTRAHYRTWIVPRQAAGTNQGFHHSALVSSIIKNGALLVWPATASAITIGQVHIHKCTGTSRNASGLAVEVHSPAKGRPVLLPADAGYGDLPTGMAAACDAIACPHHGGRSNSPSVRHHPGGADPRLAYSYGSPNSYGHPLQATWSAHDAARWIDRRATPTGPFAVRNTVDRQPSGLGHIGFNWGAGGPVPFALPCAGKSCQLAIQQM